MRKLVGFLLTLALAVAPFGGAVFAKGPEYKLAVSASADGNVVTATAEVQKQGIKKVDGVFVFKLKKGKKVISKKANVSFKDNTTKASATFEGLKDGRYKVEASFNGKAKIGKYIKDVRGLAASSYIKVAVPQQPQEPGDGDAGGDDGQQPGGDDDQQQPGGNDDQQQPGGDDDQQQPGGDDDQQQPGNNDGGSKGGTVQNPGSGNQQPAGGKLPKTATNLPLNSLLGALSILAGAGLLIARRLVS